MLPQRSIRLAVREHLLATIGDGSLAPGQWVNIAKVARVVGCSATPVREALVGLEQDGFLVAELGRGFVAAPLDEQELRDVYELIVMLETGSLADAPPPAWRLDELERLNGRLSEADSVADAIATDQAWHKELLARNSNRVFWHTLEGLKRHAARYELPFMLAQGNIGGSVSHHTRIVEHLRGGDLVAAGEVLRANWEIAPEYLVPWLRGRGRFGGGVERAG